MVWSWKLLPGKLTPGQYWAASVEVKGWWSSEFKSYQGLKRALCVFCWYLTSAASISLFHDRLWSFCRRLVNGLHVSPFTLGCRKSVGWLTHQQHGPQAVSEWSIFQTSDLKIVSQDVRGRCDLVISLVCVLLGHVWEHFLENSFPLIH